MVIFLLGGLVGSLISFFLLVSLVPIELIGGFLIILFLESILCGLLGGYAGFRLFKLLKSPSVLAKIGFFIISAILGCGLSVLILYLIWL